MAIQKLTANKLKTLPDGSYADGNGLFLRVQYDGAGRTWLYRRKVGNTLYRVGLGPIGQMSLDTARKLVARINDALAEGITPKEYLQALKAPKEEEVNNTPSLNDIYEDAMRDIAAVKRWRNEESERQWRSTMQTYVLPIIGDIPLDEIGIKEVLTVVEPIWETKTETASRVLGRLATFLNWANVHEYRTGDNPALWNGRISLILPSPNRVKEKQHHKAISIDEIPKLCEQLWSKPVQGNLAVLLGILTAARVNEFLDAKWDEFDFENRIWYLPPERRKDGKAVPHRVPLSDQAIAILKKLPRLTDYVFPGTFAKTMSKTTPCKILKDKNYNVTMHGMRSTFRDWAAITRQDWFASEKALSHSVGNEVTQAYLRTDMLDERREIMQQWADHCFKNVNSL